jgi:hypothetical protein
MGRHDVGGCANVTISEIEAAIGWWRARATSDAGFAGSVVGCALARMYGAAIAGHAITDAELDQAQRDALGAFKGFVGTATVK